MTDSIKKKDWTSKAGLRCTAWLVGGSHHTGYVEVPKGHMLYGLDYNEVDVEVHGGLTFAETSRDDYPGDGDGWWFGFDCAHSGDLSLHEADSPNRPYSSFKDVDYVERECESLASQIVNGDEKWVLAAMRRRIESSIPGLTASQLARICAILDETETDRMTHQHRTTAAAGRVIGAAFAADANQRIRMAASTSPEPPTATQLLRRIVDTAETGRGKSDAHKAALEAAREWLEDNDHVR